MDEPNDSVGRDSTHRQLRDIPLPRWLQPPVWRPRRFALEDWLAIPSQRRASALEQRCRSRASPADAKRSRLNFAKRRGREA